MRNLEYLLLHDLFPVYYVDALSRLLYVATLQVVVVAVCVAACGSARPQICYYWLIVERERESRSFSSLR